MKISVVDLDDGSLQDLWESALARRSREENGTALTQPDKLESWLRREMPYLPLLGETNYLLARSQSLYRRSLPFCPACRTVSFTKALGR